MVTDKVLKLPTVKEITGKSRSAIYLDMSKGDFPQSIKIGQRSVGWTESSINLWLEQKINQGQQDSASAHHKKKTPSIKPRGVE